jgi:hypothetical protein
LSRKYSRLLRNQKKGYLTQEEVKEILEEMGKAESKQKMEIEKVAKDVATDVVLSWAGQAFFLPLQRQQLSTRRSQCENRAGKHR